MVAMSADHDRLLDATISYLEQLKAQGTRFVSVSPETMAAFSRTTVASSRQASTQSPRPVSAPPAAPQRPPTASPVPFTPTPPAGERSPAVSALPPSTPLSREAKAEAMEQLRERAAVCVKCPNLVATRKSVVFGVGDIHAPIMFVGEAPGADEDAQGEPFVGAAGQLLTKIIQTMGLSRQTVYIANILKCRPDTPGQTSGNRKPSPDEMKTCLPYLQAQIDLIQPRVLVGLGATAVEGLLNKAVYITKIRGQWHTYRGIPLMSTFHPSYLLRNQSL